MYVPRIYPHRDSIFRFHVVQRGETLDAIAERYGLEPQTLAVVNGVAESEKVKAGQLLALVSP